MISSNYLLDERNILVVIFWRTFIEKNEQKIIVLEDLFKIKKWINVFFVLQHIYSQHVITFFAITLNKISGIIHIHTVNAKQRIDWLSKVSKKKEKHIALRVDGQV